MIHNVLPNTVQELFENKEFLYEYYSKDSMDNFWSMDWFIKYLGLEPYILINDGTQIFLEHPDFSYQLQVDAGGLGDFYSHKFEVSVVHDSLTEGKSPVANLL